MDGFNENSNAHVCRLKLWPECTLWDRRIFRRLSRSSWTGVAIRWSSLWENWERRTRLGKIEPLQWFPPSMFSPWIRQYVYTGQRGKKLETIFYKHTFYGKITIWRNAVPISGAEISMTLLQTVRKASRA